MNAAESAQAPSRRPDLPLRRWVRLSAAALPIALFAAAVAILHSSLRHYRYHDVVRAVGEIPPARIAAALGLAVLAYAALTAYDYLALRYVKWTLPYRRIAFASFVAYAFSHNLGLSLLSGAPVRYRLYASWGLDAPRIARIVAFGSLTFWLGFAAVGGAVFLLASPEMPASLRVPFGSLRFVGALLALLTVAYLVLAVSRKAPVRLRNWKLEMPGPRLAAAQLAVSALDWTLSASVLAVLLPANSRVSLVAILGFFLVAQIAGLASQVPGGLGVFESLMLLLLSPHVETHRVLAALLVFRVTYYLIPLGAAVSLFGVHEALRRRREMKRLAGFFGRWLPAVAPQVVAAGVFVSGAILLFSGATPAVRHRLAILRDVLPLPVLEMSHFLASVVGMGLLLLARGLSRRLDVAYHFGVALLAAGALLSLLKGLDWEEASILAVTTLALLPCRRFFYRRSALTAEPMTAGWVLAIAVVVIGSTWLGVFAHKHVPYSNDLWWQFSFHGDAPRFLRATVGAVAVAVFFALARLLRPARPARKTVAAEEIEQARAIAEHSPRTLARLALLGDKLFLFSASRNAFVMYGIEERTWASLGDPVGPAPERSELAWNFRELVDRHGGWTIFYQVEPDNLPLYIDLGLTLLKIGENARVSLQGFSLEGGSRKGLRHTLNRLDKEGCRFEILPEAEVVSTLPELEAVSDAWLRDKHTREKSFSLGSFREEYLRRSPAAIVRRDGHIVAFANILKGAPGTEMSVDLMRYSPEAPPGVMDYLFAKLLLEAQRQGYEWFDLGMAPLSGMQDRPLAPWWHRVGSLLFRHGENFYNFQGLRQYKEKFDPVWEARYIASPGGFALPRILANLASLISGGLRGAVAK